MGTDGLGAAAGVRMADRAVAWRDGLLAGQGALQATAEASGSRTGAGSGEDDGSRCGRPMTQMVGGRGIRAILGEGVRIPFAGPAARACRRSIVLWSLTFPQWQPVCQPGD